MCTLSFVPRDSGYYVAMNRDELVTREFALPPQLVTVAQTQTIYPQEPTGGTWIAANEYGITLALLNWNLAEPPSSKQSSRGSIIPQLIAQNNFHAIAEKLKTIFLEGILPFRLIGICYLEKLIYEWRWDGLSLGRMQFDWKVHHWFSSGLSDNQAEKKRGKACLMAWSDPTAGTEPWLRKLHRSHSSEPGPFSICVHRSDAKTVSYAEIDYGPEHLNFRYIAGQPCDPGHALSFELSLNVPRHFVVA
jgi:hypothetical protein